MDPSILAATLALTVRTLTKWVKKAGIPGEHASILVCFFLGLIIFLAKTYTPELVQQILFIAQGSFGIATNIHDISQHIKEKNNA